MCVYIYNTNELMDVNYKLELYDSDDERTIDVYCGVYCLQLSDRRTVSPSPVVETTNGFWKKISITTHGIQCNVVFK